MPLTPWKGLCLFSFLAGALAASAAPAPAAPAVAPEIVKLPDLVVTDRQELPRPESWRYVRTGRYEVLSAAAEKETRAILHSLRDLDLALEVVWPALRGREDRPFSLILCDSEPALAAFAPAGTEERRSDRARGSVFLRGNDHAAIVLLSGATILNMHVAIATSGSPPNMFGAGGIPTPVPVDGLRAEPEQQLRHDYTLFLLSEVSPRLPAWAEEGLARLVMGMKISEKQLEFAKLEDPNAVTIEQNIALSADAIDPPPPAEDRQFQSALALSPLMGFPELFAVQHDSPVARNVIGSVWAKQAAAFVHLCLYGEGKRYQAGFLRFLTQLTAQPPSEELFRSCFGMGYAAMGGVLRTHVLAAAYTSQEWNLRKGGAGFPKYEEPRLREATQAEVGRIKGETLELAGKVESAGDELYAAYRRGERDPQLIEAIGLFDADHGDRQRAAQFLTAAVAANTSSLPAYVSLARLRLDAALAHAGPDRLISPAEVDQVAAPLRQAAGRKLVSPELFELLAEAWRHSAEKISRDDAVLLIRGALTYPNRLLLMYRAATAAHDAGLEKEAQAFVARGLKLATTEKERVLFQELKTSFGSIP